MSRNLECAVAVQCRCGAKIVYVSWDEMDEAFCGPDCSSVPPLSREPEERTPRKWKRNR